MGIDDKVNKIHLIDFGLSVQYLDEEGVHIKAIKNYNTVVGTALFASINAHHGAELSRKDDIESLVYTLIYLCLGTLPWKNISMKKKKERHQLIMYMKEQMSESRQFQESLSEQVPEEFFEMLALS